MRAAGRDISRSVAPIMTSVMPSQSARMGSTGDNLGALSVASRAGVSLKTRDKCGLGHLRPATDGPGPGERQGRRGGELISGNSEFLMAARKRKKNKSSNYLISLDKDDLARNSGNFFGKLRSNFIGAHPRPAHSGSTRPATRRPTTRPERLSLTGESGPLRRRHRIYAVR